MFDKLKGTIDTWKKFMSWTTLGSHRDLPNTPGIYVIRHTGSGKEYVGLSNQIRRRVKAHQKAESRSSALHAAIRRWGAAQFQVLVLALVALEEYGNLAQMEIDHIALRGTRVPFGYNIRSGGVGSLEITQAERQAHADRARMSRTGTNHTPETKALISASLRGQKRTIEQRARMSESKKGVVISSKVRAALRQVVQRPVLVWVPGSMCPTEYGSVSEARTILGLPHSTLMHYLKTGKAPKNGTVFAYARDK